MPGPVQERAWHTQFIFCLIHPGLRYSQPSAYAMPSCRLLRVTIYAPSSLTASAVRSSASATWVSTTCTPVLSRMATSAWCVVIPSFRLYSREGLWHNLQKLRDRPSAGWDTPAAAWKSLSLFTNMWLCEPHVREQDKKVPCCRRRIWRSSG